MKRKHKSKVEKICSKERPTVTQKLHDMREECENKRHLRFLVSDNGPRMRACQVAIPGNLCNGAAFDMHGRELGRLRPRSLRIHFSKETVSSYIFEIKKSSNFQ